MKLRVKRLSLIFSKKISNLIWDNYKIIKLKMIKLNNLRLLIINSLPNLEYYHNNHLILMNLKMLFFSLRLIQTQINLIRLKQSRPLDFWKLKTAIMNYNQKLLLHKSLKHLNCLAKSYWHNYHKASPINNCLIKLTMIYFKSKHLSRVVM